MVQLKTKSLTAPLIPQVELPFAVFSLPKSIIVNHSLEKVCTAILSQRSTLSACTQAFLLSDAFLPWVCSPQVAPTLTCNLTPAIPARDAGEDARQAAIARDPALASLQGNYRSG